MEQEVTQEIENLEEDIAIAVDVPVTKEQKDAVLNDEERMLKCIHSLFWQSETIYCTMKTKVCEKILIKNNNAVYVYHDDIDCFELTELPYNSEEDYIILELIDINENDIPIFKITTTTVETGTFRYFWLQYISIPFWRFMFSRG